MDSAQLLLLQKQLLNEYENILFQEETMWYQKSHEKWIKLGSCNTVFFHAYTVIRRKRNKIHGLSLPSGNWCTDPNILKSEAVIFFKNLSCSSDTINQCGKLALNYSSDE